MQKGSKCVQAGRAAPKAQFPGHRSYLPQPGARCPCCVGTLPAGEKPRPRCPGPWCCGVQGLEKSVRENPTGRKPCQWFKPKSCSMSFSMECFRVFLQCVSQCHPCDWHQGWINNRNQPPCSTSKCAVQDPNSFSQHRTPLQQLFCWEVTSQERKKGGKYLPKQRNAHPLSSYKDRIPAFPKERKYFYFLQALTTRN